MEHTEGPETPGRVRAWCQPTLCSPPTIYHSLCWRKKKKESQPVMNYGLYNGYFSL